MLNQNFLKSKFSAEIPLPIAKKVMVWEPDASLIHIVLDHNSILHVNWTTLRHND